MSAATIPSLSLPPPTKQTAAAAPSPAAASTRNHLPLHPIAAPLVPLSLILSSASHRLHNSVLKSASSDRLQPPNRNKPPSPLHVAANLFKGCTDFFSDLISKNQNSRHSRHCSGRGGVRNHNFFAHVFSLPAIATEDKKPWDSHGLQANSVIELKKLSGFKKYKISDVKFLNPRTRAVVNGADEAFSDLVDLNSGNIYTKHELTEKLQSLSSTNLFDKIEFEAKTNPDGSIDINIPFKEKIFPSKSKFRCISYGSVPDLKPIEMDANMTEKEKIEYINAMNRQYQKRIESAKGCILPEEVEEEIEEMMWKKASLSASFMRRIERRINKWYHDNKYYGAKVVSVSNPENPGKEMVFEVAEGEIKKMKIRFQDKLGNACEGNTDVRVIRRVLPDQVGVGKVFNKGEFDKALQNLKDLDLFSHMEFVPEQDDKTGAMSVELKLQQLPQKWSELNTEWTIVPGPNRLPTLASLQPGATISFGHRNIKGLKRSFQGSITLSNLFDPQDDVGFNLEYNHPYVDGVDDPRNRTFQAACFNTRKLSPVFRAGPDADNTPTPLWVDRFGVKANITEYFTKQSRFTYGLVVEDIKTRGEGGEIVARGDRVSVNGESRPNGPPTTLSGTGVDRMAFLQANLTRDNTKFVNGAVVGDRNVFQVDQGLGIGAYFNRHKLSATKFIPLTKVEEGASPAVLVLHGLYGGCVGDLPNHEAFTIGGPHSVRGYNMGEIGASRNKVEVAAEVRVPVKGTYVYAFAEHGNDLGSSKGVEGNPTKSYMRRGSGSSYGGGVKLGQLRAEYAVDNNTGEAAFFFHCGDRF